MAGADEFATELAEHAFIEVVLGEHASAQRLLASNRTGFAPCCCKRCSRQSGDAAADDGNRARSGLLGVSAPVQDGCERRRAGRRCGESQQLPPRQRRGHRFHERQRQELSLLRRIEVCATSNVPSRFNTVSQTATVLKQSTA
jgi:hypothetical protein